MTYIRLRHIILFLLMAVFVTPIRAGISTDYLLGGALTLKNGRIDKYYFEGGFARAFETSATTDLPVRCTLCRRKRYKGRKPPAVQVQRQGAGLDAWTEHLRLWGKAIRPYTG